MDIKFWGILLNPVQGCSTPPVGLKHWICIESLNSLEVLYFSFESCSRNHFLFLGSEPLHSAFEFSSVYSICFCLYLVQENRMSRMMFRISLNLDVALWNFKNILYLLFLFKIGNESICNLLNHLFYFTWSYFAVLS